MPARPFRLMDIWLVAVIQTRVFFANKTNSLMLGKYASIADGFFSALSVAVIHNIRRPYPQQADNDVPA
ncbi:hypothetical protein CBW22_18675 [Pantoea sp. VS1]|uniref:hypothetical protein n=1 Tax=Pantoea TaxID=53335 RepID=UPI000B512BBC|nr:MULTISPECIES: hypothetical protein [Pantoea]OWS74387.1 hypothetical protein CBW22_18675 [Pantoea sp. VS1]QZY97228.1 hypothetical protein K7X52_19980 [Pantoea dispersa]